MKFKISLIAVCFFMIFGIANTKTINAEESISTASVMACNGRYNTWLRNNNDWYYCNSNAKLLTSEYETINGERYHFGSTSKMIRNSWMKDSPYSWYDWNYYDQDGKAVRSSWRQISGSWYYFNNRYEMVTGNLTVNGNKYNLGTDGKMLTNFWENSYGSWKYYQADGSAAVGWKKVNNYWYYFGYNNNAVTGKQNINGRNYYFKGNGQMYVNTWYKDKYNTWLYADENGALKTNTWMQKGGLWYYFNSYSEALQGHKLVDGHYYTFDSSTSEMKTNTWNYDSYKWTYHLSDGRAAKGWLSLGNKWYYFGSTGNMYSDYSRIYIDGVAYKINSSGHVTRYYN